MAVLLDTNVLLRLSQPGHAHSVAAEQSVDYLRGRNEGLNITSQNLVEFWAVATRTPSENGLGLSIDEAVGEVETLKGLFTLLPEAPLQGEWEHLVKACRVSGKNAHDARIVAAMLVHHVASILTFNGPDFVCYPDINVLDPRTLF